MSNSTNSIDPRQCVDFSYIAPIIAGTVGFISPLVVASAAIVGPKTLLIPLKVSYITAIMGAKSGLVIAGLDSLYSSVYKSDYGLNENFLYIVGESAVIGGAYGLAMSLVPCLGIVACVFPEIIPVCLATMMMGVISVSDCE